MANSCSRVKSGTVLFIAVTWWCFHKRHQFTPVTSDPQEKTSRCPNYDECCPWSEIVVPHFLSEKGRQIKNMKQFLFLFLHLLSIYSYEGKKGKSVFVYGGAVYCWGFSAVCYWFGFFPSLNVFRILILKQTSGEIAKHPEANGKTLFLAPRDSEKKKKRGPNIQSCIGIKSWKQ